MKNRFSRKGKKWYKKYRKKQMESLKALANKPLTDLISDTIAASSGRTGSGHECREQAKAVLQAIEDSGRTIILDRALQIAIKEQPKPEDVAKKISELLMQSGHTSQDLRDLLIEIIDFAWEDYCKPETAADLVLFALADIYPPHCQCEACLKRRAATKERLAKEKEITPAPPS